MPRPALNDRVAANNPVISRGSLVTGALAASADPNEGDLIAAIRTALPAGANTHFTGCILANNGAATTWIRRQAGGTGTGIPIPPASMLPYIAVFGEPATGNLAYQAAANELYAWVFYDEHE